MKSIHNKTVELSEVNIPVIAHVKLQFEINSQPIVAGKEGCIPCDCSRKITI